MARDYEIYHYGGGAITAAKTMLQITAAAGKPVKVHYSEMFTVDNATSYQVEAFWRKITTPNGASAEGGTTTVSQVDEGGAAQGFTAIGDLSAEPTLYSSVYREPHAGPSVLGYKSHQGPSPKDITIEAGDSWGLYVSPASAAATTWHVYVEVTEEGS